jgi:glutamyl-Q tRNA(Asp) synthetase
MYVGRFAPSPSGPLHFGSLLAAVASYVDARAAGGHWLVRLEDLDPPREMPGADKRILATLEAHALHWDSAVLYQSQRHEVYRSALADLAARGLTYRCTCNRARLATLGHRYDGWCRTHIPPTNVPCAIRLIVPQRIISFRDRIQGQQQQPLEIDGDYIVHRKDGLFAYQLAVVVDDIDQGVTDIVRGRDILDSTARQIFLTELLGGSPMRYAHIPLALGPDGQKLSKQNHAPSLDDGTPTQNLWLALHALKQQPPEFLRHETPAFILQWAVQHWRAEAISMGLGNNT